MKIIKLEVGQLGANCYIVYCKKSLQGAVIDPGGDAKDIIALLHRENIKVDYIINTHGHADHIAANDEVKARRVLRSAFMRPTLLCCQVPKGIYLVLLVVILAVSHRIVSLKDGDILMVGEIEMEIIHTWPYSWRNLY